MDPFRLLWLLSVWILKSTSSLYKLYYHIGNRRGIPIKLFRQFENLSYKLAKKSLDKRFFTTCLDLEICPNFLKFQSPRLRAYENPKKIYQQVVREQLKVVEKEIEITHGKWVGSKETLFKELSFLDKRCVSKGIQIEIDKRIASDLIRVNRKLERTWCQNKKASPNCLINLSSKTLDVYENNVLYLGLNHHILPKRINDADVKVEVEKLMKSVVSDVGSLNYDTKEEIKSEVQSFLKNSRRICSAKSNQSFHRTIKKLADDDAIAVCKFDKGNGVVIMDRSDYEKKCYDVLSDSSKFEKLDFSNITDIILKKRASLQNYVYRYLYNNDGVDKLTYSKLYDVGSSPGKFYGLVKVHKDGYPIRPVVSMIGTPEYGIAKWLDTYIKPNIPDHCMLKSTDHFVDVVRDFPVQPGDHLVSYDVKSLYTNVPLKETVDVVTEYVYSEDSVCKPPIPRKTFRTLLLLVTQGNFIFNGEFYRQIDGLAMGGPLGPSLANFFLAHLEKTRMSRCPTEIKPKLYLRYIDDIFALLHVNQSYEDFFSFY